MTKTTDEEKKINKTTLETGAEFLAELVIAEIEKNRNKYLLKNKELKKTKYEEYFNFSNFLLFSH